MPNHAHYIVSADKSQNISHIMRDFNTHTSREITALLTEERKFSILQLFSQAAALEGRGNRYKVWQEGFHPIALETEDFIMQKLNYLHDNPVRKGYVEEPEHWKYSSARNYLLNDHTIIPVECLF
jgi:REP element-mobilizing transposase RayT